MNINIFGLAEKIIINCIFLPLFISGLVLTFTIWTPIVCIFYGLSQLTFYIHKLEKRKQENEEDAFNEELDKLIEGLQTESEKSK